MDPNPVFPVCRALLGDRRWASITVDTCRHDSPRSADEWSAFIRALVDRNELPEYLAELAEVESLLSEVPSSVADLDEDADGWQINPAVQLLETRWSVAAMINTSGREEVAAPMPVAGHTLVWYDPRQHRMRVKAASQEELFCLKMCAEDLSPETAAAHAGRHPDSIHNALCRTRDQGLLIGKKSKLVRGSGFCTKSIPEDAAVVRKFVLQWHITHACDLHCKHCYDRSRRSPMTLEKGYDILDQLGEFCRTKNVSAHVCFSGGNPLMSDHFFELYDEAAKRGYELSILGNPASRENLERITAIRPPIYYQVSLEGLPEHNDEIRGHGFYHRVIEFLGLLRDTGIRSGIMLTLTRDNLSQVLPLAERLRGHTDSFTFNRLSPVGEGAALAMPDEKAFLTFLGDYHAAMADNPILSIKDNLFNVVRQENDLPPFDGCTGFGCGAAFNFVAMLPDGDVHACRKFPTLIGNAFKDSLLTLYDNRQARKYRTRPEECRDCELAPTCGGCLAVSSGLGVDPFICRDPYCPGVTVDRGEVLTENREPASGL